MWQGVRAPDGVGGGGGSDHQAGGVEGTGSVGAFYGFIDGGGEAEVVGGEGETSQVADTRLVVRYASRRGVVKPMLSRRSSPSASMMSGCVDHAPFAARR